MNYLVHIWRVTIGYWNRKGEDSEIEYTYYTKVLDSSAPLFRAYKQIESSGAKRYYLKRFEYTGKAQGEEV